MTVQELEALERSCDRMLTKASWAFGLTVPGAFVSLWLSLDAQLGAWVIASLLPVLGNLVVFIRLISRSERLGNLISTEINRQYADTEWITPAGARGVALEAYGRGRRLRLAFPTGVIESYETSRLSPVVNEVASESDGAKVVAA